LLKCHIVEMRYGCPMPLNAKHTGLQCDKLRELNHAVRLDCLRQEVRQSRPTATSLRSLERLNELSHDCQEEVSGYKPIWLRGPQCHLEEFRILRHFSIESNRYSISDSIAKMNSGRRRACAFGISCTRLVFAGEAAGVGEEL